MSDEPETEDRLGHAEIALGDTLSQRRPVPGADFRGALGRHLTALDPRWGPRPARLPLLVVAYLLPGLVLIGLGALIGTGAL